MSFGLSISDFIEVADRARKVYKSCKNAPREYQSLANSVDVLRGILDDTEIHLETELPDAPNKQRALVTARRRCEDALDAVEELLKKYPSLAGQPHKKLIERMKFINKDVDGLKEELNTCGNNVERCLTSLMSVSMVGVTKKLDQLLSEYKGGQHEKSVMSLALNEGHKVDEEEALDQLEKDLQDKDLHPDAFDMHRAYIREWMLETITEDGFAEDETEYQTAYEHPPAEQPTKSFQSQSTDQIQTPVDSAIASISAFTRPPQHEDSDDEYYGSSVIGRPTGHLSQMTMAD